ncbi:hypothetical protein ACTXT7_011199 [Hymenolepis weldensis]
MSMPVSQELANIFEEIDANYNGYITRDELERYVKRTGQPEEMVDDWFKWFDFGNTGKITFEDMCETLAIGMSKNYSENVEKKREMERETLITTTKNKSKEHHAPPTTTTMDSNLMEGVKILYSGSTKKGLLEDIVLEIKNANIDHFDKESQFARYLKENMEKKWGQHWQVVVSKATFGCSVGHEEDCFVHFQYGPYLYILYRTPE